MSVETTGSDPATTRRGILKKAAIGGAAAYAVPLAFGTSSALAAFGGKRCVKKAGIPEGADTGACGVCASQVACGGSGCTCVVTTTGCCFCHQPISCDATPCASKADCPAGYECAYTCCGGTICVPPCGVFKSKGRSRRMSSRR